MALSESGNLFLRKQLNVGGATQPVRGDDLDHGRRSGHGAHVLKHLEIAGGDTRADSSPGVPESAGLTPDARAAVIGAGLIGRGIAQVFSTAGYPAR
jgi:hypothetical protein